MDLLGGYDSNDNSDSENSNEDDNNTIKNLKHESSNGTELTSKAAQNAASTTTAKTEVATNTKAEKRGRKILSLNAVLPSNIFNQLVMQKGNTINKGVSDDESSSSSEDDHDDDEVTQGGADVDTMKKSRKKARKRFRTNNDEKEGLQSLLHELHSIKGGNVSTNNDPIKRNSNGAVNSNDVTNYNKKEDVDLDNSVEIETTTTKATPAIRSTAFSSIPRPSSSNMYKNTLPRPKAPAPSQPVQSHVTQQYHTQEEEKQPPLSQKQIIQALRKGNIPSSIPTIQMSGHTVDPSDIEITQDHHASASTIPNPQLELYNPNQGKMVSAQEVRHKRKNQIHHLLKQAHVLESTKPVSGSAGNSSRADAKKKYGW